MSEKQKTIIIKYDKEIEAILQERGFTFEIEDFLVLPEVKTPDLTRYEIALPSIYEPYFDYFETYFQMRRKAYLEDILRREIETRNQELKLF